MMKNYITGGDNGELKLGVTVGTPGIANTVVFRFKDNEPDTKIAESNVDSGNVLEKVIGSLPYFKNTQLKVRTIVNFVGFPSTQWEQLGETVAMKVKLSGGFSGSETFQYDEEDKASSESGKVVVIDIMVNLS
jgi:hypothetical protein